MRMVGKGDTAQRLLGNLQGDSSKALDLRGCDCSHLAPFGFELGVADIFSGEVALG